MSEGADMDVARYIHRVVMDDQAMSRETVTSELGSLRRHPAPHVATDFTRDHARGR